MQRELGAVAQGPWRFGQHAHAGVHPSRRAQRVRPRQHVASPDLISICAGEVGRHPAARRCDLDRPVVLLQPADPYTPPAGHKLQLVADADRPFDESAGDHRAEAAHREDAIDREARTA